MEQYHSDTSNVVYEDNEKVQSQMGLCILIPDIEKYFTAQKWCEKNICVFRAICLEKCPSYLKLKVMHSYMYSLAISMRTFYRWVMFFKT